MFAAYVVLQLVVLATLSRGCRYVTAVPLLVLVPIAIAHCRAERTAQWPLAMIFVSPLAVLYLLAIAPEGLRTQAHARWPPLRNSMYATALAACLPYACMGVGSR